MSLAERPELLGPALELHAVGWPEFMQHDPAAERYEARLAGELAAFQVLLLDEKDELAAAGVSIPFAWDGTVAGLPAGWDAVVAQGLRDRDQGRPPTALSALAVTVAPDRLGHGLSPLVIEALKPGRDPRRAGQLRRPGATGGQERLPADPDGAVRPLDPPRRRALRPLAAHPVAARRHRAAGLSRVDGGQGRRRQLGAVDGHAVPRHRPLRRARGARAGRDRPPAGPRALRRAERLGPAPASAAAAVRWWAGMPNNRA